MFEKTQKSHSPLAFSDHPESSANYLGSDSCYFLWLKENISKRLELKFWTQTASIPTPTQLLYR